MASWFTDVPDTKYDYLWSSRKVVKNQYYNKEASAGYYGCDIWGEAHSKLSPYLTKGLTLYYEIIGWLPTCHNDVPHEGIVIRIENGLSEA